MRKGGKRRMSLNTITPVARLELFLQDIADGNETPSETPVSRPEEFLRRIAKSNGEQDAALEHIADQIPIDPTSEDVGKVLTVIEDTSGEEPVYKWGAEEMSGAPVLQFALSLDTAPTTTNITSAKNLFRAALTDAQKAVLDEFSTAFRNCATIGEREALIENRVRIYKDGIRAMTRSYYPNTSAAPGNMTYTFNLTQILPVYISGSLVPASVVYDVILDCTENASIYLKFSVNSATKIEDGSAITVANMVAYTSSTYKILIGG